MNWALAAAPSFLIGILFAATGRIHPAILAYHLLCGALIVGARSRVRPLLARPPGTSRLALGCTLAVLAALACATLVLDPAPYRATVHQVLIPWGHPQAFFAVF